MKNLIVISIFTLSFGAISCIKDDVENTIDLINAVDDLDDCLALAIKADSAQQGYDDNPSVENCMAYRSALEAIQNSKKACNSIVDDDLATLGDCSQ